MGNRYIFGHGSSTIRGLIITRIRKAHGKQYNYDHVSSTIVGLIITRIRKKHMETDRLLAMRAQQSVD